MTPATTPLRPVVGLSAYRERAQWNQWDVHADLLTARYSAAVERAGAVPVILPISRQGGAGLEEAAATVVARLDALIVSGGADVSPGRYDEEPGAHTRGWRDDRDAWELALLDAARDTALPVLGICRGMQVMAVHARGALVQHVPDVVGGDDHRPGARDFATTPVRVAEGSRLRTLVGTRVEAPCHHHQSVRTHPGFDAVAWAADGLLEAIEQPGDRFCLAVQWHPEQGADQALFTGLVAAARARLEAAAASPAARTSPAPGRPR